MGIPLHSLWIGRFRFREGKGLCKVIRGARCLEYGRPNPPGALTVAAQAPGPLRAFRWAGRGVHSSGGGGGSFPGRSCLLCRAAGLRGLPQMGSTHP